MSSNKPTKNIHLLLREATDRYLKNFDNLDRFESHEHPEVALKLIEEGFGYYVAKNLEKFENLNHTEITQILLERGEGLYIADYIEHFVGIDRSQVGLQIISDWPDDSEYIAANLDKFQGPSYPDLVIKLVELKQLSH